MRRSDSFDRSNDPKGISNKEYRFNLFSLLRFIIFDKITLSQNQRPSICLGNDFNDISQGVTVHTGKL